MSVVLYNVPVQVKDVVCLDKWIIRIQKRDETVFLQLIEKYGRLMWRLAWDILKDVADVSDVEDCISEVYYKLWKSSELLDPEKGSLKNYLAQMTRNTAIDIYRRRSREATEPLDEAMYADDHDNDPLSTIIRTNQEKTLSRILDAMNERDRELINRRYYENQKPAQISVEMQLPIREVENRLYRIKGRIREQLQNENGG